MGIGRRLCRGFACHEKMAKSSPEWSNTTAWRVPTRVRPIAKAVAMEPSLSVSGLMPSIVYRVSLRSLAPPMLRRDRQYRAWHNFLE